MSETRGRILEYDVLRAAAALIVVTIHVLSVALAQPQGLVSWRHAMPLELTLWVATPAFAFLTGALVWTMRPPETLRDLGRFFGRRVSIVAVPYVVWSLVYIAFLRPTPRLGTPGDVATFGVDVVRRIAFGGGWFHLYFIPVVVMLYLAAPLVCRVSRRFPWAVLAGGLLLGQLHGYVPPAPSDHLVNLRNVVVSFVWFVPFAGAGAWFGVMRERVGPLLARAWPTLLAAGLALRWVDLTNAALPNPYLQRSFEILYMLAVLFGFFGLLAAALALLPRVGRAASALAVTSFTVYLAHPLVIRLLEAVMNLADAEALWGSPLFAFAAIAAVAAFCHGAARLALLSPVTAWLVRGPFTARRVPVPQAPAPAVEPLPASGEA